jgi:hypothetical protein
MKRVTGIGGIFFMRRTQGAGEWYKRHLGIDVQAWGGAAFEWTDEHGQPTGGTTAWCISSPDSNALAPGAAPFVVNYRTTAALLQALRDRAATCSIGRRLRVRRSAGSSTRKGTSANCGSRHRASNHVRFITSVRMS